MKNWFKRFIIFASLFIIYYLFIVSSVNLYTQHVMIDFFIISLFVIIALFLYEHKTYNLYLIYNSYKFRKYKISFNLLSFAKWSSFVIISSFFTLFIGHLITSGIQRENIGVSDRSSIDIEHSIIMSIDDFKVSLRCLDFYSSYIFIRRERADSYRLINQRRGKGNSSEFIYKSSALEKRFEQLDNLISPNSDSKSVDWVRQFCININ